ncbi:MAG: hypothetical protein ACE5FU_10760 [Nitrospinota bacterium]
MGPFNSVVFIGEFLLAAVVTLIGLCSPAQNCGNAEKEMATDSEVEEFLKAA